jgi:hypothetical protein
MGTIDDLADEAEARNIVSMAYVAQAEDGSYEMNWCGDVEFPSSIEALKVLIRNMRKAAAKKAKADAAS